MPNRPIPERTSDDCRRFSGLTRLYGEEGQARLATAHVCVVGIGGVGSWAAEALARSGVGRLTLIDLDHVAESNINRQIQAADPTLGQAKVEAMRARIAGYAPDCGLTLIDDFVTPENAAEYLDNGFDYVIDAIDSVRAKVAMIAVCHRAGIPLVTCGAAGGKTDPTRPGFGSTTLPAPSRIRCCRGCALSCASPTASRASRTSGSASRQCIPSNPCALRPPGRSATRTHPA